MPLATWQQKGYLAMPHIQPYLAAAGGPAPGDCQYMLVTGLRPDAVWHNARLSLVYRIDLFIAGIQNLPNGLDTAQGQRLIWLSTQPTTLTIIAPAAGAYALRAIAMGIGPSLPGQTETPVEIVDARGAHTVEISASVHNLPLTLAAERNTGNLRCLGKPEPGPHNGDPRELMAGINGISIERAAPTP